MEAPDREALDEAMRRLADGDRRALDAVYRGLWPPVLRLCQKMVGAGPDAEDAAQRALLELVGKASKFEPGGDALRWALSIAAWECRSVRTQRRRRRDGPLESAREPVAPSTPEGDLMAAELRAALAYALEGLDPRDREVLQAALEGEVLGPSQRKRKQRALERLRKLWRRAHGAR